MSIIGISLNRENPEFTLDDFIFWQPQFANVMSSKYFHKLVKIANNKIFKSIWGTDWEYAMSLCIAHYMELIAQNMRIPNATSLKTLSGGASYKGVMDSVSVGAFSKSLNIDRTLLNSDEALFWNQTAYGSSLMALYKTKAVPSIFVITGDNR